MSRQMAVLVDGFAAGIVSHPQDVLDEDAEELTRTERATIREGCRKLTAALDRADRVEDDLDARMKE